MIKVSEETLSTAIQDCQALAARYRETAAQERTEGDKWELAGMYDSDAIDAEIVATLLKDGEVEKARSYVANLDTSPRENYPRLLT